MGTVMHSRVSWEGQEARINPICASSSENTNLATLHFCFSNITLLIIPYTHHAVFASFAFTQDMAPSRKAFCLTKIQIISFKNLCCPSPPDWGRNWCLSAPWWLLTALKRSVHQGKSLCGQRLSGSPSHPQCAGSCVILGGHCISPLWPQTILTSTCDPPEPWFQNLTLG